MQSRTIVRCSEAGAQLAEGGIATSPAQCLKHATAVLWNNCTNITTLYPRPRNNRSSWYTGGGGQSPSLTDFNNWMCHLPVLQWDFWPFRIALYLGKPRRSSWCMVSQHGEGVKALNNPALVWQSYQGGWHASGWLIPWHCRIADMPLAQVLLRLKLESHHPVLQRDLHLVNHKLASYPT